MKWLLKFFRFDPLPAPYLDTRSWQVVDFKRSYAFKH